MKNKDVVFNIVEQMLSHSPKRSYKRLNPALRSMLSNCIEADLPFLENTFSRIYAALRGSWWFGDGAGSHIGEHFYTLACSVNHASAQQSFESFAGRPACIWEENTKTPFRLHVGARFTWKGCFVTVTSMRKDRLVACSHDGSNVRQRFTIPYDEIAILRRTAKKRVNETIKRIYASKNPDEMEETRKAINSEHFRHFELEDIRAAFLKHGKAFADQDKIAAWRKGGKGAWLESKGIHLRIIGDRVECSNGNSIKTTTAIAVLPIILSNHGKRSELNLPLDSYTVERVEADGVKIGCTLVPWPEIDYIARELKIAA